MGEHRVRSLSPSLRRYEDPARSSDPRIRELVTQLATLEPGPEPRAHFRAELRAQLVAVTPRLVAEGPAETFRSHAVAEAPVTASAGDRLRTIAGRLAHVPVRRPLGIVVGVFAVFALLLG